MKEKNITKIVNEYKTHIIISIAIIYILWFIVALFISEDSIIGVSEKINVELFKDFSIHISGIIPIFILYFIFATNPVLNVLRRQ